MHLLSPSSITNRPMYYIWQSAGRLPTHDLSMSHRGCWSPIGGCVIRPGSRDGDWSFGVDWGRVLFMWGEGGRCNFVVMFQCI